MSSAYKGMGNRLCPTCNKVIEYPFCLDKFHDQPKPNKIVDNLNEVLEQLKGGWWH